MTHIIFLAFVNQAAKQTLSMVYNVCSGIPERGMGIVSECHDPSMRHVEWKEFFEPEGICLAACPGSLRVSAKAMDRNNTSRRRYEYVGMVQERQCEALTQP